MASSTLGYFPGDSAALNGHRVSVLVIHYPFEGTKGERHGNAEDVRNLRSTFEEDRGCIFRELKSPKRNEVLSLLGSDDAMGQQFNITNGEIVDTDVLLLFILSHGREDGFIETDSGEHFTTYEVINALKKLSTFKDTLKLIFFGPCRGQNHDTVFFTRGRTTSETHEVDSCAVGSFPNESNFIIFYSTVESTKSIRDNNKGSWMVQAVVHKLRDLKKDTTLEVFLTKVQQTIYENSKYGRGQTPEVVYLPHKKYILRSIQTISHDGQGAMIETKSDTRDGYFPWSSDDGRVEFTRGSALIFHWDYSHQIEQIENALRNFNFETHALDLSAVSIQDAIDKANIDINAKESGSILLAFITKVGQVAKGNGLEVCVDLGGDCFYPVQDIISQFVSPREAQWIGKPKMFFFLDDQTDSDNLHQGQNFVTETPSITATCHSGIFTLVASHKDIINRVVKAFLSPGLMSGTSSLQEEMCQIVRELGEDTSPAQNMQITSTLQYLVDFQEPEDTFVQPTFTFNSQPVDFYALKQALCVKNDYEEPGNISSDACLIPQASRLRASKAMASNLRSSTIANKIWLLTSAPGMGKSTTTEKMKRWVRREFPNYLIYHLEAKDINSFCLKEDCETINLRLLLKRIDAMQSISLEEKLAEKRIMVLVDGIDEIWLEYQTQGNNLMKQLEELEIALWITSRPHELNQLAAQFNRSKNVVLINPFDRQQQLQLVKSFLKRSDEECTKRLENLERKGAADLLANPFHLRLLIGTYEEDSIETGNLFSLYDSFVNIKIKQALQKEGVDITNAAELQRRNRTMRKLLMNVTVLEDAMKLKPEEEAVLKKGGIVYLLGKNNWSSFHQTVFEFLVCLKHLDQLHKEDDRDDCLDMKYSTTVRKFIDSFFALEKNQKRDEDAKKWNKKMTQRMFENSVGTLTTICDEGLVHTYHWLSGLCESRQSVLKNSIWFNQRLFKKEPAMLFFLACYSNQSLALAIAERFSNIQKMVRTLVRKNKLLVIPVLEKCIMDGNLEMLQEVLSTDLTGENFTFKENIFCNKTRRDTVIYSHVRYLKQMGCSPIIIYDFLCNASTHKIATKNEAVLLFEGLHVAVILENVNIIKLLIKHGADVNGKRPLDLFTLLQVAAEKGNEEVINLLLSVEGIEISQRSQNGLTALHLAADNNAEVCRMLVEKGADLESVDDLRQLVLHRAAYKGNLESVEFFTKLRPSLLNCKDKNGRTPLHLACDGGHLNVVQKLIAIGADRFAVDVDGCDAFLLAACLGFPDIVSYALENKYFNPDTKYTPYRRSAFMLTVENKQHEVAKLLIEHGCNVNQQDDEGRSPLHAAVTVDLEMLLLVLENGGDATAKDKKGLNALMFAASCGVTDTVKHFLEQKTFNVNEVSNEGGTALHFAAYGGRFQVLKMLVEAGCHTEVTDVNGRTALHIAATENHTECVEFLLNRNPRLLNLRDIDGCTALQKAAMGVNVNKMTLKMQVETDVLLQSGTWGQFKLPCPNILVETENNDSSFPQSIRVAITDGNYDLPNTSAVASFEQLKTVKVLIENGADASEINKLGFNALHWACRYGTLECVRYLVENNKHLLSEVTNNGLTVLHLAARNIDENVTKYLLEKGANAQVTDKQGLTPLQHAALDGTEATFNCLIEKLPPQSLHDETNNTASIFHLSAVNKDNSIFKRILKKTKKTELKKIVKGFTELHVAVEYGNLENIQLLLDNGADPNVQSIHGFTLCNFAALKGQAKAVELLVRSGASTAIANNNNRTVLQTAAFYGHVDIIRFLTANKKLDENKRGGLSLHLAAYNGHLDVVKELVTNGFDLLEKDSLGRNVLFYAIAGKVEKKNPTEAVIKYLATFPNQYLIMWSHLAR